MTTAIERQKNLPPHVGDISYGSYAQKYKEIRLFKSSVEWLLTIYEIRKGSEKF